MKPRWPGTPARESTASSFARGTWGLVATVFVALAMGIECLATKVLGPVDATLRKPTHARLRHAAWPWTSAALTAMGCGLFVARGDAFARGGAFPAILAAALAYVLLGAYRWSARWLMERESNYASYEAMLAAFDGGLTGWCMKRLRRPEDAVWIRHTALSTLVHLPPTIAIVFAGATSWFACCWFAVAMIATVKTGGANHQLGHYRPFRRFGKSRFERAVGVGLSFWYHFVVELLEGDVPHLTISGHNLIHHVENNGPGDYESTYPYDRTSFVSSSLLYLNCAMSYSFGVGIVPYLWQRRRRRPYHLALGRSVVGLVYTYGLLAALALHAGIGMALFVLGVRLLQSALRYGIFAYLSHAFVDPDDPTNSFSNSMEAGTRGTLMLGGGQHALHHAHPGRHWAQLTTDRRTSAAAYVENGTVIVPYEAIPFVQPLLFAQRFDELARWLMGPDDVAAYEDDPKAQDWSPVPKQDAIARRLAQRARPPTWTPPGPLVASVDAVAARALLWSSRYRFLEEATETECPK